MTEDLASVVEKASALVVEALGSSAELVERVSGLDRDIKEFFQVVGRLAMERLFVEASKRVTEAARARGLTVERRPVVQYRVLFGEISVESPYLWNRDTHEGCRPVRSELGVEHLGMTEAVKRALTDFGAEDSFGRAAKRFEEHYGWEVGRTTVLRVVETVAAEAESFVAKQLGDGRTEFGRPLSDRPGAERILVEADGGEVRTGKLLPAPELGTTPARKLAKRRRLTEWRDLRMGLARRLDEVEPTYVGRLGPYARVLDDVFDAACLHGLSSNTQVIACTDGGIGIREAFEAHFPKLQYVLDRPHMKSHLYETADAMGLKDVERERWVARQTLRLHQGQAETVLDDLHRHRGRGRARALRLHVHLTRFKDAVHYDAFEVAGIPQGSGEIESAHKAIPQKRLKLPGAWWREDTINPMLALRLVRANTWWGDFWSHRAAA